MFIVDSKPGVFKYFSKIWACLVGISFIIAFFSVFHSLEACPWLCFLWCHIYQLLLLFTNNIVVFSVV